MQLSWFLNRLSKMSMPEIPWRVCEKLKKAVDKQRKFVCPKTKIIPRQSLFLLSKNVTPQSLHKNFPQETKYHLSIAEHAIKNNYSAFGYNLTFNNKSNWHTDPVTQLQWPLKFWGDINYRDKQFGGPKFVWEINRLYCLSSLTISYRITKQSKYADKIINIIISWIKTNPYPKGVNWTSGIEVGVRLVNVIWALSFLQDYSITNVGQKAIDSFIWFHAIHLHRYPSKFSSANNHLLAEGLGLFMAGIYFPNLKPSRQWFKKGKNILENEISRQILPDGGSFEYSTTYLSFVFDFFLFFKIISDQNKIKYSQQIDTRLKSACSFIKSLMDINSKIPNIGDQDSAILVDFGISNMENLSSILNTGSILFDKKFQTTSQTDLKTFILTGNFCNFLPVAEQIKKRTIGDNRLLKTSSPYFQLHKHSGIAIIRDDVNNNEILFTGNATPMGMPPLYAHGHLDALSFTLTICGLEFFVDPGTYLYHSGGEWRRYFRSTAAHNTLRLNMKDMSEQPGDFMFGKPYRITKNTLEKRVDEIIWKAAHNAYANKHPFAHICRTVIWKKSKNMFRLIDQINQKENSFADLHFHCHPECSVVYDKGKISITRQNIIIWMTLAPEFESEIYHGSRDPISGWYSQEFNDKNECNTIRLCGDTRGNAKIENSFKITFEHK